MAGAGWHGILEPDEPEDRLWETFHENSKLTPYGREPAAQEADPWMGQLAESLGYDLLPAVELPRSLTPLQMPLAEALRGRASARGLERGTISLQDLATVLASGYGVARSGEEAGLPRSLRTAPSAGALYPLEVFLHAAGVEELPAGLYHYHPVRHELRVVAEGDETATIAAALAQRDLAAGHTLLLLLTALFERTTIANGDRGYRYALLEAGHVAQNVSLAAAGLGLGCVCVGAFFDRAVDDLLGLDGVLHSTVYLIAIGKKPGAPAGSGPPRSAWS